MEKHITLPLTEELAKTLHAGDTEHSIPVWNQQEAYVHR